MDARVVSRRAFVIPITQAGGEARAKRINGTCYPIVITFESLAPSQEGMNTEARRLSDIYELSDSLPYLWWLINQYPIGIRKLTGAIQISGREPVAYRFHLSIEKLSDSVPPRFVVSWELVCQPLCSQAPKGALENPLRQSCSLPSLRATGAP